MERGDHLISPRMGYSHHGLYLGRNQVIHYSGFSDGRHKGVIAFTSLEEFCQGEGPPRQNSCRPDRIDEQGAMMEERIGSIRTGIQG